MHSCTTHSYIYVSRQAHKLSQSPMQKHTPIHTPSCADLHSLMCPNTCTCVNAHVLKHNPEMCMHRYTGVPRHGRAHIYKTRRYASIQVPKHTHAHTQSHTHPHAHISATVFPKCQTMGQSLLTPQAEWQMSSKIWLLHVIDIPVRPALFGREGRKKGSWVGGGCWKELIYVPIKERSGWGLPVQGSSSRPL